MQYRPFWWNIFDPRLTGGLIAIIVFLFLTAVLNTFAVVSAVAGQSWAEAGQKLLSVVLYALPAYGLLKLYRWARLFEIGYSLLMVVLGFYILLAANLLMGTFIVVTHGVVGIYLLSNKCRKVFYPPQEEEEKQ